MRSKRNPFFAVAAMLATAASSVAGGQVTSVGPVTLLVSGLQGASGSAVGPGGALYVTEGLAGRISRVDPDTGTVSTGAGAMTSGASSSAARFSIACARAARFNVQFDF